MSQVLSGLAFCFVYPDNMLVYSTSWKEHLKHLEMVFKCLKEVNLKIKLDKCQIFKQYLHYLGPSYYYSATTGKGNSNRKTKGSQ